MKKVITLVLMLVLFFAAGGCRTAQIYNINNATITPPSEKVLTAKNVEEAIVRAGTALGWKMKPDSEGHILGTLALRTHVAIVDINYTPKTYSITYKDSTNLKHSGNNIHSNYNGWIQNLEKGINNQINLSAY